MNWPLLVLGVIAFVELVIIVLQDRSIKMLLRDLREVSAVLNRNEPDMKSMSEELRMYRSGASREEVAAHYEAQRMLRERVEANKDHSAFGGQ